MKNRLNNQRGDILEFILMVITVFLVGILIVVNVDKALGHDEPRKGIVVDKAYTAPTAGTGVGSSANGSVSIVVTSTPEVYTLFIKAANGEVISIETDKNDWLRVKVGDVYTYTIRIGKWSGC